MSRFDYQGKTVVITGASSGIGAYSAVEFARRGAKLVLSGRKIDELNHAAEMVQKAGGEAHIFPADVTKQDEMKALVSKALELTNRIDVMFLGAGFGVFGRVDHISMELWRKQMDVNFWGVLYGFYEALPHLMKQKSGQFVIINSGSGRFGLPYFAPYCASKFALTGFADSARFDLREFNIDVLSVYPAFVVTKFHQSIVSPDFEVDGRMAAMSGGISAEQAAEEIVDHAERRKKELIFSAGGKFAAKFFPMSMALAEMGRKGSMGVFKKFIKPKF
jgi:dehydrogenase/reductase SDR family member 7B